MFQTTLLTFLTLIAMLACRAQVSYLHEHRKIGHFCVSCVEVSAKYVPGLQLPGI